MSIKNYRIFYIIIILIDIILISLIIILGIKISNSGEKLDYNDNNSINSKNIFSIQIAKKP